MFQQEIDNIDDYTVKEITKSEIKTKITQEIRHTSIINYYLDRY